MERCLFTINPEGRHNKLEEINAGVSISHESIQGDYALQIATDVDGLPKMLSILAYFDPNTFSCSVPASVCTPVSIATEMSSKWSSAGRLPRKPNLFDCTSQSVS